MLMHAVLIRTFGSIPTTQIGCRSIPSSSDSLVPQFQPGEYYLGLSLRPVGDTLRSHLRLEEEQGLVIMSVLEDSSASEAGLEQHDVLTFIDGVKIVGQQMLVDAIQEAGKNDREVELSYIRAGEHAKLSLKPMKRENFEANEACARGCKTVQVGAGTDRTSSEGVALLLPQ